MGGAKSGCFFVPSAVSSLDARRRRPAVVEAPAAPARRPVPLAASLLTAFAAPARGLGVIREGDSRPGPPPLALLPVTAVDGWPDQPSCDAIPPYSDGFIGGIGWPNPLPVRYGRAFKAVTPYNLFVRDLVRLRAWAGAAPWAAVDAMMLVDAATGA